MGRVSALIMSVVLSACALTPTDEEELGETTEEVQSTNRLAANKLSAYKLQLAHLGDGALATTVGNLVATADGREVLSYVVGCALAADDRLSVLTTSQKLTFVGSIGLAPMWKARALSASEKRWVSACVLARTNLYGIQIQLSLRGAHPVLAAPLGEGLQYALVEGAFYGDLFETQPEMYACSSLLKETGLPVSTLGARACAKPVSGSTSTTACGFTYVGPCALLDLGLIPACTGLLPPYAHCRAGARRYDEVITVALSTL
jgi:hypothetical protein